MKRDLKLQKKTLEQSHYARADIESTETLQSKWLPERAFERTENRFVSAEVFTVKKVISNKIALESRNLNE